MKTLFISLLATLASCTICAQVEIKKTESICVDRTDKTTVCDSVFEKPFMSVYTSKPIRGSVADIKWAGDSIVVVRAFNTLSGYSVKRSIAEQYFQYELNEDGNLSSSDIAISNNDRWLAMAEKNKIKIYDLKDGSLRFERIFTWLNNKKYISAIAFSNRGGGDIDDKPNLIYSIFDGEQSELLIADLFSVVNGNRSNCQNEICGLNGSEKRVDIDPLENKITANIGTIYPRKSFAINDAQLAGFEGLLQSSNCKDSWAVSAARGNPTKAIDKTSITLGCRRFAYPTGYWTLDYFSKIKFPNHFTYTNQPMFEPIAKGKKMLIAVGTSDKCEGILIDEIIATPRNWKTKPFQCIKGDFASREVTALRFSKNGQYIAIGGADTEFTIITYPEQKNVSIN